MNIATDMEAPCEACGSNKWHQVGSTFCLEVLRAKGPALADEIAALRRDATRLTALHKECAENAATVHEIQRAEVARLTRALAEVTKERTFPIQAERGAAPHPRWIPWSVAERAYSGYSARYGGSQSLERVAERGGFGPGEMDAFLPGWRNEVSEISKLRAALEEARAEVERQRERCQNWQDFCLRHPEILPPDVAREMADLRAEVSRLRGQVEGAWRAGVEAALANAVAYLETRFGRSINSGDLVNVLAYRSLPPPSAPADDTDTNHKEKT